MYIDKEKIEYHIFKSNDIKFNKPINYSPDSWSSIILRNNGDSIIEKLKKELI